MTQQLKSPEQLQATIDEHGFAVVGMHDDPQILYTIGLNPEIIITGLPAHQGMPLLNDIYHMKLNLKHDMQSDALANLPTYFKSVTTENKIKHMVECCQYYDTPMFPALQLFWPDKDDNFPWHSNDTGYKERQPNLCQK